MFDRYYLEAFRADVLGAIETYCAGLRKAKQPLSQRRAKDIDRLKKLLRAGYFQTQDCLYEIKGYLKQMQTGFWVFSTGNSRLKRCIEPVVARYEDTAYCQLRRQNLELTQKLPEGQVINSRFRQIQQRLLEAEAQNLHLRKACKTLTLSNHVLAARVTHLAQLRCINTEKKPLSSPLPLKTGAGHRQQPLRRV